MVAAGAALVALARWRLSRYAITGGSMTPALAAGDYVVVDKLAYSRRLPEPGDIALARDPREPSRVIAKRVAALEPGGAVVLLGDNRDESTDSRVFGPLPPDALTGRVRWRYWPPARFGPVR
ncbi:MAG: nickel-type superoxide dismutase maturation protease [Chloroflexi bacterium]|nr:nickel-type superoxide dismutase maturation protease [Chloroflexota bacterium]